MNRFVVPLVAVLFLLAVFYLGLKSDPSKLPSQYIGKAAPVFDLPTLKDPSSRLTSEDLKGQISLVNIWATWCIGCLREHGFLMQLHNELDIPIFGINWRDDREKALRWLDETGDPYRVSGFDGDARVGIDWGAYGAPETFLLNVEGQVIYRHAGELSQSVWDREFEPRIRELRQ